MDHRTSSWFVRLRPFLAAILVLAAGGWALARAAVPSSIALLYFPEKNFRVGDWVLYKVRGADITGAESVDYQRLQIGQELEFRGERCFWLETGWGTQPDTLAYSAVLVSDGIFEEEMPEVRHSVYMRKMMVGFDDRGIPRAMDVRLANPSKPLPDLSYLRPRTEVIGKDTLQAAGRTFVCDVVEETREFSQLRDLADSTARYTTETRRVRWVNPGIPITGLVRERERKVFYTQVWPVGQPSKDFPPRISELHEIEIDLLEIGEGAEPLVSDRIQDTTEGFFLDDAPR